MTPLQREDFERMKELEDKFHPLKRQFDRDEKIAFVLHIIVLIGIALAVVVLWRLTR